MSRTQTSADRAEQITEGDDHLNGAAHFPCVNTNILLIRREPPLSMELLLTLSCLN